MASPPKPWKAEYAKSGRSSCRTCKSPIDKEVLRLGKMVQSTQFDGFMPMWNHARCILKKAKQIKSCDDVEGIETLRWEDQQKIRQYVESGGSGSSSTPANTSTKTASTSTKTPARSASIYAIEISKTARATCKICSGKIMTGEVRISSKPEGQGARGLAWHHAKCFIGSSPTTQVETLDGWESLPNTDKSTVGSMVKEVSTTKKDEVKEEKETLKGCSKRKATVDRDQKSKMAKTEDSPSNAKTSKDNNSVDCESDPSKLSSLLEAQTKELWALKDDLKKHVSTSELKEMLEANDQDTSGSELDLRDRCADGMLFGALKTCELCSGHLHYSGGTYKCKGFLTEWSKCAFSTSEPERVKGKWNIPEETKNQYLKKWFKTQKTKKPVRIMPPPSSSTPGKLASTATNQSSHSEILGDLKVSIIGFPSKTMDEWKNKIQSEGAQFHAKIKKDTNCLVVSGVPDYLNAEMKKARRMKIPIVREDYLVDCFERKKKLRFDLYKIETNEEANKSMVTVKVKGRSAVHEASGLQDTGHILEHGKSIYNTTLSLSDLSTGVNSYYILQIIEDDKGSDCHVFRKWGRVGNEKIGGIKLEEMRKEDAIQEFKRLFLEKTGNSWEAWEQKTLRKQPGRFYPLEIDYGVSKDSIKKNKIKDAKSQLAPPLAELMKMLFNVETYRAAMMEFEINMAEMPLGKLSKRNIQQGFEVLTELQDLLNKSTDNPAVKDSKIVDASNRFFTVIPSVHPHVIKDEDDFKSKVKMLEALQDIEIASRLVGFDVDNDDSLDDKYKKLQCEMVPLPHDSEDYRLVEKYLQTTHAPTHTDWALELEEVFTVERQGEFDKFSPYKNTLKNKMLLWHGSRLTNFVGILSQGLRIAPPEAPATGYMFGKGVYFADLVSKSAQYCFTDKKNPVGLMLLSEVALGEMYELKKAKYIDKPPKGKHSTKGLGKKIPNASEHVNWKDDVIVPCGKPVPSNVKATDLMYTFRVPKDFIMMIRIRSRDGVERLQINNPNATIAHLKTLIEQNLHVPINNQTLSTKQKLLVAKTPDEIAQLTDMSNPETLIESLGIGHGSIIFLAYEGERRIAGPKVVPAGSFGRKMTMDDLIAKQMRIVRQENAKCEMVSFDRDAANGFQNYVNESLGFGVKRGGFMYGTVSDEGKVEVDFIYEAPQQGTEDSLVLMRDEDEERVVEAIALGLGMRKVGFIFTQTVGQHGKRDYTLSNREVLQAVEMQAGETELKEWVTVVVKLEVNEEGGADVHFEAFQMSDLCVKLFKEGWFQTEVGDGDDPKLSKMNKDVVVGGKDTREVDNDFFLVVVKIFDHQGPLSSTFPVENRNTVITMRTLKNHLDRTKHLPFVKRISDFHLLLLLGRFLDVNSDVPALAGYVRAQATIPEGYQILIESMAASG